MNHWIYLALAIVCEVIATSSLKACAWFTNLVPSLVVAIGYAGAFFFLSLAIRSIPVGVAYAIWSGVGIVIIAGVDWWLHGQKIDLWTGAGMGLIIVGVAVINVVSKTTVH
ncbi:DMT family transporter [Lacunimicrobium album]